MPEFQTAIVVGASAGIGAELTKQLAQDGTKVAAVARRLDRLEGIAAGFPGLVLPYGHDVTNTGEAAELFQRITDDLGGLDLVIYCAGVMPDVGPHEYDTAKDVAIFETNVLGAMAWLNAAAGKLQVTMPTTQQQQAPIAQQGGTYRSAFDERDIVRDVRCRQSTVEQVDGHRHRDLLRW